MKKYIQITIFSVLFLILVIFIRNRTKNNTKPITESNTSVAKKTVISKKPISYKNGVFIGNIENIYYGNVQVKLTISSGKISNINVLQYPNDNPTSSYISSQAIPLLKSEAIKAQNANISIITGASYVSTGFIQSLHSAISKSI